MTKIDAYCRQPLLSDSETGDIGDACVEKASSPVGRSVLGVRNYVLVISTVSCANVVAERIARSVGAIPVTHHGGCAEFDEDKRQTRDALLRTGCNPNVAGVLVVGLGCEQIPARPLAADIGSIAGIDARSLLIQECGGAPEAIECGVSVVKELQAVADAGTRVPCPVSGLVVGVHCGGSDWTTALSGNTTIGAMADELIGAGGTVLMSEVGGFPGSEHLLAERAVSYEVGIQILDMVGELRADYRAMYGQGIEEVNPTPGNKDGGITTLVEKSMGNIKKMGSGQVQGIVRLGDPIPHPGIWILDSRSRGPDTMGMTAFGMQGAHIAVFCTGRGTPAGSAVMPVIKITGNSDTYRAQQSIIDFNAGTVIDGVRGIRESGKALYQLLLDVAGGRETKSELNLQHDFVIPRTRGR